MTDETKIDLVEKLRLWASTEPSHVIDDLHKAADEIQQLRQSEFMWKMTAIKVVTKLLPLSLLLSPQEKEELQIILQEAAK